MTAIGIDVGGTKKGLHAVALGEGAFADHISTKSVEGLAHWCRQHGASVIAIDAPCRWSLDGRARPAERRLMEKKVWCFSTPTRECALAHPKNHFGWLLNGMDIYDALADSHPLCEDPHAPATRPCAIETFPHAATWHLLDGQADAKIKNSQRRKLLLDNGIDTSKLTNIDLVDAALCALVANRFATGFPCQSYGEQETGFIIVPAG